MPNDYIGYDISRMNQNPYYNPYMPGPDWGSGTAGVYSAWEQKRQKEQQRRDILGQQEWERQRTDRQLFLQEKEAVPRMALLSAQARLANAGAEAKGEQAPEFSDDFLDATGNNLANLGLLSKPEVAAAKKGNAAAKLETLRGWIKMYGDYSQEKARQEASQRATDKATDWDKKMALVVKMRKEGQIKDDDVKRFILGGADTELTPNQMTAKRMTIDQKTLGAISGILTSNPNAYKDNNVRTMYKNVLGLDITMPREYNLSKARIEGGVGDQNDEQTVQRYDQMFDFFMQHLHGRVKSKDIMEPKDPALQRLLSTPGIDKDALARWAEFYK